MKLLVVTLALLTAASASQAKSINYFCSTADQKQSLVVVSKDSNQGKQLLITTTNANAQDQFYYSILAGAQAAHLDAGKSETLLIKSNATTREGEVLKNAGIMLFEPVTSDISAGGVTARLTLALDSQVAVYNCSKRF